MPIYFEKLDDYKKVPEKYKKTLDDIFDMEFESLKKLRGELRRKQPLYFKIDFSPNVRISELPLTIEELSLYYHYTYATEIAKIKVKE
jgi:hypothetical protein